VYVPARHAQTDPAALQGLVSAFPFGLLVTQGADGPVGDHLPFVLDHHRGTHGVLRGHVARANPVWRTLEAGAPCLVVFQGEQAYMSPGWCASKAEHGKVVPTWNYRAVHASGRPRLVSDPAEVLSLLRALTDQQEAAEATPWAVDDAPPSYIDAMACAIVAFEIEITHLQGRWKLSQSDTPADRAGMVAGLRQRTGTEAHALADQIQAAQPVPLSLSTTP
jgi:transcriptional regulator